jgi:hypothetical protein
MVHNHGTEEWLGLACPERVIDGKSKGLCLVLAELAMYGIIDIYP